MRRQVEREVERADAGDRTDGIPANDAVAATVGRRPVERQPLAVDAQRLLRRGAEGESPARDLAAGVLDRLARLATQQGGQLVGVALDASSHVGQRVAALEAGQAAGLVESIDRRRDGSLQLIGACLEGRRHQLAGRRVSDLERRPSLDELAGQVDRNGRRSHLGRHGPHSTSASVRRSSSNLLPFRRMNPIYLLLELSAAGFFVLACWLALRRGRLPFLELASAATFGLLLEEGDQLIFETYQYSPDFVLAIDRAPILIGLTWALIIAGAMRITDALGVRRRYAPVVDSVLAIMLDIAFDAVAIRMGLWTWRDVGLENGWFGVPYGNFYSWLFVTFAFSFLTRRLRDAAQGRPAREWLQLLVPIPAFVILIASIVPFAAVLPAVDPSPGGGGLLFLLTFAVFLALAGWGVFGPDRGRPNGESIAILDLRLAFVTRIAIHLFFLAAIIVMGVATSEPMILVAALVMLAAELPLAWLTERRHTSAAPRVPHLEGAVSET